MPRGRPRASSGALVGVVASLQSAHRALISERAAIDSRISVIESALHAMRGTPATAGASAGRGRRAGGGRSFRRGSLKEYIHRVLSNASGPMAVRDVTAGVMRSGFKTKNKTLSKSVGIALTQMPMVSKVGRGLFKI